jgi:hypothetical protein
LAAQRVFRDRDDWLKPHQRMTILRRLAGLVDGATISPCRSRASAAM